MVVVGLVRVAVLLAVVVRAVSPRVVVVGNGHAGLCVRTCCVLLPAF